MKHPFRSCKFYVFFCCVYACFVGLQQRSHGSFKPLRASLQFQCLKSCGVCGKHFRFYGKSLQACILAGTNFFDCARNAKQKAVETEPCNFARIRERRRNARCGVCKTLVLVCHNLCGRPLKANGQRGERFRLSHGARNQKISHCRGSFAACVSHQVYYGFVSFVSYSCYYG